MDCCSFCLSPDQREAKLINRMVEKRLREEKQIIESEYKLLILGTGESGKSTFLRQIKLIHGKGYDLNEKMDHITAIRSNVITCITAAIEKAEENKVDLSDRKVENSITNLRQNSNELDIITDITKESIDYLCECEQLKEIIENSWKYKLPDSAE